MSDLLFRLGTEEDQHAIQSLVEIVFGSGRLTSEDFFDWQYRQNPCGRAVLGCCEAPDGRIVACLPTIPVPVRINGQEALAALILNVATHPEYRRKGLFVGCANVAIQELASRGFVALLGFPNEMIYWGYIRKLEFREIGRPRILRRFFNLDSIASQLGSWGRWAPVRAMGGLALRLLQRTPNKTLEVKEIDTLQGLPVERLMEPTGFGIAANAAWLDWRYSRHPFFQYKTLLATDAGRPAGVAVYKIDESHSSKRGILMDLLLAEDSREAAAESLSAHMLEDLRSAGCGDAYALATPGSRKDNALRSCGYWAPPNRFGSPPKMIFRALQSSLADMDFASVDFSAGMLDTA